MSESDFDMEYDAEEDDLYNPDTFLNQFGGYESDDSEDPDDDDETEEEPKYQKGSSSD
jgi:hypothetical protein